MGIIAPYAFRGVANNVDEIVHAISQLGLGHVELQAEPVESYAGAPQRRRGFGGPPGGERWAEYKLPDPFLSRSPGASTGSNHSAHVRDWIRACKGGAPACSNFSIAGPYVEWLVLGTIAVRVEGKLEWDAANLRFTNNEKANELVRPALRPGWELSLT